MAKNKLLIIGTIAICIIATATSLFYINSKLNNIIVIDVIKVVNEFKLKKDLEAAVEPKLAMLKNKVDSMSAVMDYIIKNNKENAEAVKQEYQYWQQKAYEAYETSNTSINEQVWKRLNPLIDEWGKKNNYRIIIGANGMGTILYNQDAVDKSTELIQFINSNYTQGEK